MKFKRKSFVIYWHFVEWSCISIGINVDVRSPNIEIHLPFGFIKIGVQSIYHYTKEEVMKKIKIKGLEIKFKNYEN